MHFESVYLHCCITNFGTALFQFKYRYPSLLLLIFKNFFVVLLHFVFIFCNSDLVQLESRREIF